MKHAVLSSCVIPRCQALKHGFQAYYTGTPHVSNHGKDVSFFFSPLFISCYSDEMATNASLTQPDLVLDY